MQRQVNKVSKKHTRKSGAFCIKWFLCTFYIRIHRRAWKSFFFDLPDRNTLKAVLNKHMIKDLVEKNGQNIPKTFFESSKKYVAKVYEKITYPCLIKPINSFIIGFPAKTILVNSKWELEGFFHNNPQYVRKTIVQALISGDDKHVYECTAYYNTFGIPLYVFTMRKKRQYPFLFGITFNGESIIVTEWIEKPIPLLKKLIIMGFVI